MSTFVQFSRAGKGKHLELAQPEPQTRPAMKRDKQGRTKRSGPRTVPVRSGPEGCRRFAFATPGVCRSPLNRQSFLNPKGIVASSPGLRGTSYPGLHSPTPFNPERVAARPGFLASRSEEHTSELQSLRHLV